MHFKDIVRHYIPMDSQEVMDQQLMLQLLESKDNIYDRQTLYAHVTSSVFILNKEKTKVLMGFHNIYQSWGWFGGHNDLDPDCKRVALKEATEETGIEHFELISDDIISLDCVYVANHIKKGKYVPDHLHLNVTYGLLADETDLLNHNEDEHEGLRWFDLDTYLDHVKEDRMKPIYTKILSRML